MKNCLYQSYASSLSNIIQHAEADTVDVTLSVDQESISLTIKDNGRGFLYTIENTQGHYGLANTEIRAQKMGGKLQVSSSPDQGTHIKLTLPVAVA